MMYELLDVNPKLKTDFFKTIALILPKNNFESLLVVAMKNTVHKLFPELPFYTLQSYMQKTLQPIHDRIKYNIHTRYFIDESEAIEVWHNTYDDIIKEMENSSDVEDKINLELIYCIYDLLKYDKVTVIDGKKYLHSFINLNFYGNEHFKAYEKRLLLENAKRDDKNFDIATNRGKSVQDRVKFLSPILDIAIQNPLMDSKNEELQKGVVQAYCEDTRMMARCIHGCSILSKHANNESFIDTIGNLKPYLNSDEFIPLIKIYESWYAHVKNIYMYSSDNNIPLSKILNLAHLSSLFLFDKLRAYTSPVFKVDKLKIPIRERSIFDGLRLLEFTDNRTKITRSSEELEETELFLSTFLKQLNSLIKS